MPEESPRGITLTVEALQQAKRLANSNPDHGGSPLRLYLDGKGCDGFYYGVAFDQSTPEDFSFESDGVTIVVDPDTLEFTDGSSISWVDDERGQGFLVNNPNHRKFRGKFYKRPAWREKLNAKKNSSKNNEEISP